MARPLPSALSGSPSSVRLLLLACLLLAALLLGGLLLGGLLLGGRRGSGGALALLLVFLLLDLLDDDLHDLHLGQVVGAASLRPALLVLEDLDALGAGEDVAGALQRVLATQAFIDRHGPRLLGKDSPRPAGAGGDDCARKAAVIIKAPLKTGKSDSRCGQGRRRRRLEPAASCPCGTLKTDGSAPAV